MDCSEKRLQPRGPTHAPLWAGGLEGTFLFQRHTLPAATEGVGFKEEWLLLSLT